MHLRSILSLLGLCLLPLQPAQAQAHASQHRADLGTADDYRGLTSVVVGSSGMLSCFLQPELDVRAELRSVALHAGGRSYRLAATELGTFEGLFPIDDEGAQEILSGNATVEATWSDGVQVSPVGDIGFAPYGAGSGLPTRPGGVPLALHGVGHAVPGGPVVYVGDGLLPGSTCLLAFSQELGGGEWAPGVARWIGDVVTSIPFVIGANGKLEWDVVLPTSYRPGQSLFAQVVGIQPSGSLYATPGLRMEVKRVAPLVVDLQPGHVAIYLGSGYEVSSAFLGTNGLADSKTQRFLDVDPDDPRQPGNAGLIGHPALTLSAGLVDAANASGEPLEPVVAEQLVLIGSLVEVSGAWDALWVTDGCTMPWGPMHPPWVECCNEHDVCYCIGGDEWDRLACDEELRDCILAETGNKNTAKLFFDAVREHGWNYFTYYE